MYAYFSLKYVRDISLTRCASTATHLNNYMFDGARADLTKSLSMNPLFQVTHSFAMGSQTLPSSYNFGAIFANQKVCRIFPKYVPVTDLRVLRSSFKEVSTTKATSMLGLIKAGQTTRSQKLRLKYVLHHSPQTCLLTYFFSSRNKPGKI